MKLEGKAEIDFEHYWRTNCVSAYDLYLDEFYLLELSMQFGVYQDFFNIEGLTFTVEMGWDMVEEEFDKSFSVFINTNDKNQIRDVFDNLHKARVAAIKKVVEIYNTEDENKH